MINTHNTKKSGDKSRENIMANQTFEFTKTSHFHSHSNLSVEIGIPIVEFNKRHFIEDLKEFLFWPFN